MSEQSRDLGVAFPLEESGRASTLRVNQAVFADSARAVSPALASTIEGAPDWRSTYAHHIRSLLELGMESTDNAVTISADGLSSLLARMRFRRPDGEGSIAQAMAEPREGLGTAVVRGAASAGAPSLRVPYHGRLLEGDALRRQLDDWVDRGIAEPSFGTAVAMVLDNPDWLDLREQSIAVLGAGSQMGPYAQLCDWGAQIWPVDLPRPDVWRRVLATASAGRGTVHVPVPVGSLFDGAQVGRVDLDALAEVSGANLITGAPEVRSWLRDVPGRLTVGNYVYADSGLHVRASVAIDAIMTGLQSDRDHLTLAFLATPTDVFSVPWHVVEDARRRHAATSLPGKVLQPLGPVSRGRAFQAHYADAAFGDGDPPYGIADNLVVRQGPNYALAKRMQRWRATVAREQGATASLNIAPPTRTVSVVKNRAFALAYAGMSRFGLEVFDPEASNALMAAMLVHDLRNPASSANPGIALSHPLDLFVDGANPGGMWRCPYEPNSIMTAAAVAGLFERRA